MCNVQAVTITKAEGAKVRGEPTTIGMADLKLNRYATSWQQHLSDKLTALFKLRRARWYGAISFEIRRSMGGSVATSLIQTISKT